MDRNFEYVKVEDDVVLGRVIAKKILDQVSQQRKVFWLISGGTSIPIAVQAAKHLGSFDPGLLRVGIVDEKIVKNNPRDSNWEQLQTAGFRISGGEPLRILRDGQTTEESALEYEKEIVKNLAWADTSMGQFGIGIGYHTGGIVPRSPAVTSNQLVVAYESDGEEHVTITVKAIEQLDLVIINSLGESKRELVAHFTKSEADTIDEPTQSLKRANGSFLYTNVFSEDN